LYLAAVLDLATRKTVGWAMRSHMPTELPLAALMMAAQRQRPEVGLIHHTNRGSQGGFNRSLQHLGLGGCDEGLQTRFGWVHAAQNAFARSATNLAA
jgi:hypothetical protein